MAKVDTQNIPSELLDLYRAALGEERPDHGVRKRYPYRVPTMQSEVGHPSPKQKIQRGRFNLVVEKFEALTPTERQDWYAAMPEWGSLLWYYNFFMLSGLMDILGADSRGAQVIKSIQNISDTIPTGGKTVTIPNAIDVTKTVVMLWGATYNKGSFITDVGTMWFAWAVSPVWSNLQTTSIRVDWSITAFTAGDVAIQIIEYI